MKQRAGFGAVAALVVLVLLAVLAAAVVRLSQSSQVQLSQAVLSARAAQAARAGMEWGTRQVLVGSWVGCAGGAQQTLDLSAVNGMRVTVSCTVMNYTEAGAPVRVYMLRAEACNGSGNCPDNTAGGGLHYVERGLQAVVSD